MTSSESPNTSMFGQGPSSAEYSASQETRDFKALISAKLLVEASGPKYRALPPNCFPCSS